jgi:hypothetical protein
MRNVFQNALDDCRGARDHAKWCLELATIGKMVSGKFSKAIVSQEVRDKHKADIECYGQMVRSIERRLEVVT